MANVGYATLTIIPSARGFTKALDGEVSPATSKAGTKASKSLVGSIGGAALGVGKIVGGAAAAVGGIVGALSIKGGIARQLQIEDAQAKLTGLGHSTKSVQSIMDDALAAVKGTAFGMGDAATVAAGATAAGIAPGKELERVLRLTADAATIAGTDMGSMGSIFNKVAASGKLQGDVIAQLQDAGVPILQMVGKEVGKTAAEVSKMASSGEIDFETFANAMEGGLGGAALKSGDTTRGALANMKASFSRFGVAISGPFVQNAKGAFNVIGSVVDQVTALITPAMERFGAAFNSVAGPALESFGAKAEAFFGSLQNLAGSFDFGAIFSGFGDIGSVALPVIGALAGALGPLLSQLPFVGSAFSALTGPVGLVVGAFAGLLAASPLLREMLGDALTSVFAALGPVIQALVPVLQMVSTTIGQLMAAVGDSLGVLVGLIGDTIVQLMPIATQVIAILGAAFAQLLPAIMPLVQELLPILTQLIGAIVPLITQLALTVLPPLLDAFASLIPVIAPIVAQLAGALIPVIQAILPVVMTVVNAIIPIVQALAQIISGVVNVVAGLLSGNWAQAWNGAKELVAGVWNLIKALISAAIQIVVSVVKAGVNLVVALWNAAWGLVKGVLGGIWSGITGAIRSGIDGVVGFFRGLPGQILGALSGAGQWLVSVGRNMIEGLIGGVKAAAGRIADAVLGPIKNAVDGVKNFLGIHSPSRLFRSIGGFTGEGMALGLEDKANRVARAADSLVPSAPVVDAPEVRDGGLTGATRRAGATGAAGPLIGSLTLASSGDVKSDLDEVNFYLRTKTRGGRFA